MTLKLYLYNIEWKSGLVQFLHATVARSLPVYILSTRNVFPATEQENSQKCFFFFLSLFIYEKFVNT